MSDKEIAEGIHYPDCWDECAYPTLASALWEMVVWSKEHPICPTCGKKQGYNSNYKESVLVGVLHE